MGGPEVLVPLSFFGMIAGVVLVPRYFKSRERREMQQTIRAAIERGQPLPPEMIDAMTRDVRPAASPARDLRAGIVWLSIAVGLGVIGLLAMNADESDGAYVAWGIAAIPTCVGLAYIALGLV